LILAADIHEKEVIAALEERGLTVFALAPENLDGVLQDIQMLGKITRKQEEVRRSNRRDCHASLAMTFV
jgi:ABC-type Fe3+-hydroxamate transport system substrate-binding protein